MAAYASLLSLTTTIQHILHHPHLPISFDKPQIKSLTEKIIFLQEFLETYSHGTNTHLLETQIASAAHAVEDALESHVARQIILAGSDSPTFLLDIEDIDAVIENVMNAGDLQAYYSMPPASSSIEKSRMVGFDDYLKRLMDKLTGHKSSLVVVPVVGMGGIGKTTLARNTFETPVIRQFFEIRAWVTVSQNYTEVLDHMDDVWDSKTWKNIMLFCPDNSKGSRIVVTTRLPTVALNLSRSYLSMTLLDEEQSWTLFCEKVFGKPDCPIELQTPAKRIVENCRGLPLSIVVSGGFLRNSARSQEFWEGVAKDTNSVLNTEGEEQCMNILYLSYLHLPAHLKPCFLYMGVFREDEEVRVSQLTKLWVAEGFLKPNELQRLEEVGEGYLADLVGRNLILISGFGSNGKIKACSLHDLVRELCLKVGEEEKFVCVMKSPDTSRDINKERRVVIHDSASDHDVFTTVSEPVIRTLVCRGQWRRNKSLSSLRVLKVIDEGFVESDSRCVNLRCIHRQFVWSADKNITSTGWHLPTLYTPRKISTFWNLQIIRIKGCQKQELALSDMWEMPQLRHVKVDICAISDPPPTGVVLENLQSLSTVKNFGLSDEICRRIPNIMKLRINLDYADKPQSSHYCLQNLSRLRRLQSLDLCFDGLPIWRDILLDIEFPNSLRKLSLRHCKLHWEDMSMIGSLPNLEVLKLGNKSVVGTEWNPVEGEFCTLKFLKLSFSDLAKWNADSCHFPVIETIFLESLDELEAIPWGIGEIPTLKFLRLNECTVSCALSAMEILVEQESYNEELRVEVQFVLQANMVRFKEKMEQDGLTSNNLHLKLRIDSW